MIENNTPWWRERMVWLVIGAPAVSIIASMVVIYLAVSTSDGELPGSAKGPLVESPRNRAEMPAQTGRNHLTTPDADLRANRQAAGR